MFSTFDLCLLLYVIRLAGWLKHCNLSLSAKKIIVASLTPLQRQVRSFFKPSDVGPRTLARMLRYTSISSRSSASFGVVQSSAEMRRYF